MRPARTWKRAASAMNFVPAHVASRTMITKAITTTTVTKITTTTIIPIRKQVILMARKA